jgi:hypothetical protein
MEDTVGPRLSSTNGVGSMGASNGEGITSMPMNSSGCLVTCPSSAASCGARLLHVFLPAWLGAPIFAGAIMGTGSFLPTKSALVRFVSTHFHFACSIYLQLHDFTISLTFPKFPLYIGKS